MQAEGEAREALSETRRLALRMAILTQVNVSYRRYQRATRQYARASELRDVEHRIAQATRSAEESDAQNRLERVRAAAASVLAERSRNRAFAEVHNALGALYAAAGVDPLPDVIDDGDVTTLARAIADRSAAIQAGRASLPRIPDTTNGTPTAALVPEMRVAARYTSGAPLSAQRPSWE